jgi:hypothetical protein
MNSDDYVDDGEIFGDEMGAYNRAGGGANIGIIGPDGKIDRINIDPLDKFKIAVDAISRNLMGSSVYIRETDIAILLQTSEKLQHVFYKNPVAYVMGYIASTGGGEITKKQFNYTITIALPLIGDDSIRSADVIRYARLWNILIS